MKIVATYDPKPIPLRHYDWEAVDADTYDGAPDNPGRTNIGYGSTREEAIAGLEEILREHGELYHEELLRAELKVRKSK